MHIVSSTVVLLKKGMSKINRRPDILLGQREISRKCVTV